MKNFPKAGLLILTLVTPALIFVFLKFFGTNHYVLPYYNPQSNRNGQIVVENGDTLFSKNSEIKLKSAKTSIEDKLTVVNYLPEICEDSCLLMLAQLERINNLTTDIPDLAILTLTESGKQSSGYSDELGKGKWKVLPASNDEARNVLEKQLGLQTASFDNKLVLIDKQGYTRGFYNGADSEDADRLMAEIKILQYEYKNSTH